MGGNSRLRGFESQHRILDEHFFTYIVVKIVMFVTKDRKMIKRGRGWPFLRLNFKCHDFPQIR